MYNADKNLFARIPDPPPEMPDCPAPLCARSLRERFRACADFELRELRVGAQPCLPACCCFLDGLVNGGEIASSLLRPLTDPARFGAARGEKDALRMILAGQVYGATAKECRSLDEAAELLLNGFCLIVFDGIGEAAAFEARTAAMRGVTEPSSDQALKGARDAFVETLRVNSSLLRRHLRSSALKLLPVTLGEKTNTRAELVWVEGTAKRELVEAVKRRLQALEADAVLTTAAIERCLSDRPASPFPQLMLTERPDRFCLNLLEGRVGLLVDGIPLGWLMPAALEQQLRVTDDVSKHPLGASAATLLRHFSMLVMLLLPALYVATATYHQEMLPFRLLLSIIESKQSVPFSTALEVLGMLVAFELLQEAGLRLPKSIGQTVSIIGALIVGQSAVEAKVVSPIAVIVVATSGIAGYVLPNQDLALALRLWRFALVLAAIGAGIFGIAALGMLLLWHLCSLDSFGRPYLSPLAEGGLRGALRAFLQLPPRRTQK
jgi:hypothetical protein